MITSQILIEEAIATASSDEGMGRLIAALLSESDHPLIKELHNLLAAYVKMKRVNHIRKQDRYPIIYSQYDIETIRDIARYKEEQLVVDLGFDEVQRLKKVIGHQLQGIMSQYPGLGLESFYKGWRDAKTA